MGTWDGSATPITRDDLDAVETVFQGALPSEFREFYLAHNGGWPIDDGVVPDVVHGFNAFCHGALPIERLRLDLIDVDPDLAEFVPFAYDAGGNSFLLSLRERDRGAVLRWLPDGGRLVEVAVSFPAFLQL